MIEHLIDTETEGHIGKRGESCQHLAQRLVVDTFRPEVEHDQGRVSSSVALMMGTIETSEITAKAQDKLTQILERD